MLPSSRRIRDRNSFISYEKKSLKAKTLSFGARILKENTGRKTRFGIVISKAVSKKATERNLLKRKVSEIIRIHILPELKEGNEIIIKAKKGATQLKFDKIKEEIVYLINDLFKQ